MELMLDKQQPSLQHFCKICKKGFGCGRVIVGHMRAHGMAEENVDNIDGSNEHRSEDWDVDKFDGGNVSSSNKRMYALRTNPNHLKSCRICQNCDKELLSYKSFLENAKCTNCNFDEDNENEAHPEDTSLIMLSSLDYNEGRKDQDRYGWCKRKRSFRVKVLSPSSEEKDVASCLMMLSNSNRRYNDDDYKYDVNEARMNMSSDEPEESCGSASKELEDDHHHQQQQHRRVLNIINNNTSNKFSIAPTYSYKVPILIDDDRNIKGKGVISNVAPKGVFECKACKKVFNSHQALGGHRASHKKVKGCFAARLDHDSQNDDVADTNEEFQLPSKQNQVMNYKKSKVHECSICHRVFSSGQALGGHKRCHWITSNNASASVADTSLQPATCHDHEKEDDQANIKRAKFDDDGDDDRTSEPLDLKLDLNLPAATDHHVVKDHHTIKSSSDQEEDGQGDYDGHDHSKVKLAKLSELRDINMSEGSSPWLQVGIGATTTDVAAD